jgi:sugar lactone lactonase YvrE
MSRFQVAMALLVFSYAIQAQQFLISTAAGNAGVGTTPVVAAAAATGSPRGIATDSGGNVYFSSSIGLANLVLKIDQNGLLTRVAGGVQQGFSGDGGPAGAALLSASGLAVDGLGNLYIADSMNNRVRKVSPSGIITTFAGTGSAVSSGDGGPAISASLNFPSLVAADGTGNLYIVEANAPRVRKVSVDGIITTIAGNGAYGDSGDGGPAISAQIGRIAGLAADNSGNLYFSDNFYDDVVIDGEDYAIVKLRVRRVSPDGIIATVAGTGAPGHSGDGGSATAAQLSSPGALAVDSNGNLYLADQPGVRKISADGIITTVAGDGTNRYIVDAGPAMSSGYVSAIGLAVGTAGNLFVADSSQRIRKVSADGIISTVAGLGPSIGGIGAAPGDGGRATLAPLATPTGVAVDSAGGLYIADTFDNRLRRVSPDGIIATIAGKGGAGVVSGDGGPASDAYLFWPSGLAIDSSDNLYVADAGDSRIRMISPAGIITTVAGFGLPGRPGYSGDGGLATGAQLSWPKDVALDGSGNLYIADTGNNRVRMISPAGVISTVAGTGDAGYSGDGGSATDAKLALPSGLAVDSGGNVYVADTNNFRVRKISNDGIIITIAGNGIRGYSGDGGLAVNARLNSPVGLKLDSAGNLYIADGAAVRMVSPAGIVMTVAGNGVLGLAGDGGAATSGQLGAWGLAFDRAGKLYVADPWYGSVRVLTPIR